MKKVLLITSEFPPITGGIGTYCYQLAAAATKRGHDITVFAPDYGKPAEQLGDQGLPFRVVRYAGGAYTVRDFPRFFMQVWRQLGSENYDVVHAGDWASALMMRNVNRFKRVPYMAMVHGTDVLLMPHSRQIKLLGSKIFEMPERIMTNSAFTRSLLLENFPQVDPARVHVGLLGVGPEWFDDVPNADAVLARLGIARDRFCLLTVARLDERKGHRLVFRALQDLPSDIAENMTYVVVGKGDAEYTDQLRVLAAENPVPTVFTGPVSNDDLRALYASADVFCMPGEPHPRRVEGFGLVYLEAAAQGVPAIASRVGAIPEVVVDGTTGIVIEPADFEALRNGIARLYGDRTLLAALGENARQWAQGFTWDRCAAQTYEDAQ
ncbi:MAG: glycosyltransferase family 4 protein [Coriobacteriia bacterium]|nr:glycosyltransferase family 4 protein [Coriobacteriia bacterium]